MKPCIITASGRYFNLTHPDPAAIRIEDIATALARICRFTGHTRHFYSVAEHSVLVSRLVPQKYALHGLLHDAAEAYIGDVSSPLKALLPDYRKIEAGIEKAIAIRFGIDFDDEDSRAAVKEADLRALMTERHALLPEPLAEFKATDTRAWRWARSILPDKTHTLHCHEPEAARAVFMARFHRLAGGQ